MLNSKFRWSVWF